MSLVEEHRGGFVADGDGNGERHAALARGAVRRAHQVFRGAVHVGVGQDDGVVLGAAHRLDALGVRSAGRIDVLGDGGRADEADRLDARVLQERVDGFLVAVDDVEDAFRAPASIISSARRKGTLGSFSEGLRTKVLPQAIETPNIHIGIMAGKLNGVIPAQTPSGWRME